MSKDEKKKEKVSNEKKKEYDIELIKIITEQVIKENEKKHSFLSKVKVWAEPILAILTSISIIVGVIFYFNNKFSDINNTIDDCLTESDIFEISDKVTLMYKYLYEDNGVKDQLGDITEALNLKVINANESTSSSIIEKATMEDNNATVVSSPMTNITQIGTDAYGNEYIAEDLINETVLFTYFDKTDNKEVYFLGQYNENYHWDGFCVTNSYNNDGTLFGICESNFDDGNRLDYKSFYLSNDSDEWILSNRTCEENKNIGISITYALSLNKTKNFTNTNIRINDIIYIDKFLESLNPRMIKYYSGNTSNGIYKDDTGNAYYISFNDDGTVKTLYVGKFSDSTFNDDSGNAWDIAYVEKTGYYVHNTGTFSGGNADSPSDIPITQEEINEIISGYSFDIELKWKQ